jgi:hypothetical protein
MTLPGFINEHHQLSYALLCTLSVVCSTLYAIHHTSSIVVVQFPSLDLSVWLSILFQWRCTFLYLLEILLGVCIDIKYVEIT